MKTIGDQVIDYMRDSMAMPHAFDGETTDQQQNWIAGHMAMFAMGVAERAHEAAAVIVEQEGQCGFALCGHERCGHSREWAGYIRALATPAAPADGEG